MFEMSRCGLKHYKPRLDLV